MNLQLSLKKQWFDLTKSGIKTEDYREITEYWIKRLISDSFAFDCISLSGNLKMNRVEIHMRACPNGFFKKFDSNIMTLGYPKSTDSERILKLEHKGIEIREGNHEWGAEEGKLYFVIKHGNIQNKS